MCPHASPCGTEGGDTESRPPAPTRCPFLGTETRWGGRWWSSPSPSGAGQAHDGDTVPPLRLHKTRAVAWDMQMHILLLPLGGNPPTRPALIQLQLIGSCLRGFNFTGCRQNGFILPRVPMGTQGTAACRYGTGQGLTQKQHIWPQKEALWGQMVETPQISGSCSKLPGPVSAGVSLA